ncbi:MAG: MBL fold metallo-hydrolase, partial [Flavobacterium sp.]
MRILIVIAVIALGIYLFLQHSKFGRLPSGERLERIKKSPNYREGQFQNIHHTPDLAEGVSYFTVMRKFFFGKSKRTNPAKALPHQKTDLHKLDPNENIVVWFGHSSYFIQADGKRFLVDPVFSGYASPIKYTTMAFAGSDAYSAEDMPEIDYLIISHDHWDHLDYNTVVHLMPKVKHVITGLGTGAHFERWGYANSKVTEKDWNEEIALAEGFKINTTPGRHFSGRGPKRNAAMWMSFVLTTPSFKLFIGGDSGYDTHFKEIGNKFGPFDLVFLECGQY